MTDARTHTAWLLWCISEGYTKAEDRDILTNWLEKDPIHPDDAALRPQLLAMADEVLALMKAEIDLGDSAGWQAHDLAMGLVAALQSQRVEIRAQLAAANKKYDKLRTVCDSTIMHLESEVVRLTAERNAAIRGVGEVQP